MAVKFTTTSASSEFVKCLVYGSSGIGKTKLSATAPKPLIISAEQGLLSLREEKIPVMLIENHLDLEEAFDFITTSPKAKGFQTIVLDSISDIAESVLAYFKKNPVEGNTHPQAAYGSMADVLMPLIKKFRDIPDKHVYFIAKAKRMEDQYTGITSWMPSMPGQQLGPGLPYLFDFVLPMRAGETDKGTKYRYLQTSADVQWLAKDRSGKLSAIEKPDLTRLFSKALSLPKEEKKVEKKAEKEPEKVVEKAEEKAHEKEESVIKHDPEGLNQAVEEEETQESTNLLDAMEEAESGEFGFEEQE